MRTPYTLTSLRPQTMQDKNGSVPHESSRSHNRHSIHQQPGNPSIASFNLTVDNGARKMHSADNLFGSKWDKAIDSGLSSGLSSSSYGQHNYHESQKGGKSDTSSFYNNRGSNDDLKQPQAHPKSGQAGRPGEDKWIHRDKLAKIENEELQAAGFYIQRPRAQSKQRRERDRSARRDTDASEDGRRRSRTSDFVIGALEGMGGESWDLRTPEEIAEAEANAYFVQNGSKGGSRIPVAKVSPAPISQDYLERETLAARKASEGPDAEHATITLPKSRSRSASASIREAAGHEATVKDSTPATTGRARTGTDSSKRSTASKKTPAKAGGTTTRPKTRRAPEGDPPWMFASYKPDPRLPPEEQLIPTVARRLAQEKWEKEGKFGDIYDKDFRPLNDHSFLNMPEFKDTLQLDPNKEEDQKETEEQTPGSSQDQDQTQVQAPEMPKEQPQQQGPEHLREDKPDQSSEQTQAPLSEWPLKAEMSKASTMREGSSSSSMPKLSGKAPGDSVSSPRASMNPEAAARPRSKQSVEKKVQRVPSLSDAEEKKAGCACCVVM
ncbi:hypothetical protein ESCO_006424 [Escovopsis weberi]|uniref:Uncharacterized protein n=1 Tax=Escovopsis weberi TaxID=150374 RepID=A0A0M8MQP5_ESCWE|nr:hypothetical protein ESCO_006424 [Escovopsis weberi]